MDEKKLNELKGEFIDQWQYLSQVITKYEIGEIKYEKVSEEFVKLHGIAEKINIELGVNIRELSQRAKALYEKRRQNIISELGYQP